jgi:hypothetical protein
VRAALEIEQEYVGSEHLSEEERRANQRHRAWKRLETLFGDMRARNPQAPQTPEEIREEEERIAEDIRVMRRQQRHG